MALAYTMTDVQVAILGGGCAGLSLGVRLAGSGVSFRIVEPRQIYDNDRTWSFWNSGPHRWSHVVRKSWRRWTICGPDGITSRDSHCLRYQTIEGGAFYAAAQEVIAKHPDADLALGVSAHDVSADAHGFWVETSDGGFRASMVVDTRPPIARPTLGQFFMGREIVTSKAVFDPETVGLMHFRRGRSHGVDFLYLLPFAVDRALVEVTSFATEQPDTAVMTTWLDDEIDALRGGVYEVIRTETGALPMQVDYGAPSRDHAIHLGLAGGAARPSTGYAFQRIQAQADALADHLMHDVPLQLPRDGAVQRWMDAIFLRVLASAPTRAAEIFQALFARVGRDRLERFLSGSTRASDRLAIVSAMPKGLFIAAAAGLS